MKYTDILIYFYDKKTGLFIKNEYAKELPYSDGLPLIPDNATRRQPSNLDGAYKIDVTSGLPVQLKPLEWRKKNKVSVYIIEDELHDKGDWEEQYYIPEPFFKTDENGIFSNEIHHELLYKTLPKYPLEKPNNNIKIPQWNKKKKGWEESDKTIYILDDDGLVIEEKMLSDMSDSDEKNYTDRVKPSGLHKGKFDGKSWIEGSHIADVKSELIGKLKQKEYEMEKSIHWVLEREQKIDAWNKVCENWSPPEKKKKPAMTELEMEKYLKLRFSIGEEVKKIEKLVQKEKSIKKLMGMDLNINIDVSDYARV